MFKKLALIIILLLIATIAYLNSHTKFHLYPHEKTPNEKIVDAFQDFQTFSNIKPTVAAETLCQSGFINTTRTELNTVTRIIIKNRILNTKTDSRAETQDQAGITCLSKADKWVLFTKLNDGMYFCMDSTGKSGNFGLDRGGMKCEQ